jgi:hypothetical protein
MSYSMQPLPCDPKHIKGMSERLIMHAIAWRNALRLLNEIHHGGQTTTTKERST